jgi:hypothetical protein
MQEPFLESRLVRGKLEVSLKMKSLREKSEVSPQKVKKSKMESWDYQVIP